MKNILLIVLLGLSSGINAQEVVLEKDLSNSVYFKKSGINHKYFGYLFVNYGFYFFKNAEDMNIIPAKSHDFAAGYRWNHRIYGIYSAGFSVFYLYDVFALEQKEGKSFPSPLKHDKEKLQKHNFAIDFYNRIILRKEYNQLGLYLDVGGYSSWVFSTRYKVQDKNDEPLLFGNTRMVTITGLKYIEPFNMGIIVRLGYNRFSLSSCYRLSNWIKKTYNAPQPPGFSLGLEVSLY